ncbi:hypothetical protein SAMN00777080_2779 [Aquiflexum balticum DSM 16537]|uniref:Uncharacterized protein n=1 Tax=Aquiflexum balticum DSM 16537 TaxID=758820 RepID=A0A1W2H5V8_9BACT|nr:hypothetical protein [Aquiflexum balticum]SMD44164.1 hypothetical protein SAMN00777080_2779 [Aquiflexum balticum DSM 16537]
MNEKPQILTLNLTDKSNSLLVEKGFNLYQGSLGKLVDTKNEKYGFKYHLLNNDFPPNAHEYDIVIVDFSNEETIDYVKSDNQRGKNKTENNSYLICKYPQTIFDPRGLSSHAFLREIREILKKECQIIVFQNKNVDIEYKIVEENGDRPISKGSQVANFYEFIPNFYFQQNKFGKETVVITNNGELTSFLEKYNKDFTYENTFFHPTIWENDEKVPDPRFYPIIQNSNNEIVSYIYLTDKVGVFIFPVLEDNSLFLLDFLETIAPSLHPNIFPYSTQNKWTEKIEYALPNQERLLEEKKKIEQDFKNAIETKNIEIISNYNKYSFLHKILTETGNELVSAVIQFLEWLGFEKIVDMDTQTEGIKEEDIQIETDNGLLVIEVKGIGGTSKDAECSQISKIKYRRAKERGKFDVYGLYIVNHQRHIPAKNRENPPFTKKQLEDSLNEERGLLTTWSLFNLYFDIQNGVISKKEARNVMFNYGLLEFKPQDIKIVDSIKEVFLKGEVFIININGTTLKTGDTLYIEKNNKFRKITILEIKLNDKIVTEISKGEIGIKGNIRVSKNSTVWIKNLP